MLGVDSHGKLEICKEVQIEILFSNQWKIANARLLISGSIRENMVVVENFICMRFTHFLVFACK